MGPQSIGSPPCTGGATVSWVPHSLRNEAQERLQELTAQRGAQGLGDGVRVKAGQYQGGKVGQR